MYLIVGLGNPEPEYSRTRHNIGFDAINLLANEYNIVFNKNEFEGIWGIGQIEGEKVVLLKPQTYMNDSGKSIEKVKKYFKIDDENLIVIFDDVDLPEAVTKIRKKGGAGSHNGMRSVVECIANTDFPRIRIGTGEPLLREMLASYVLEKLSNEQYSKLEPAIEKAKNCVIDILKFGIDKAMNLNNSQE